MALVARGHDVRAFLWDREAAYPRREVRGGVEVQRLPLPAPYDHPSLLFPMLLWSWAAFRATKGADVVHACDLDTLVPALAAKTWRGSRLVYDVFDFYGHMVAAPLRDATREGLIRLETKLASRADLVLLPDAARRAVLGGAFPAPVEVVMNAPSERVVEGPEAEGFVLFYGGNLGPDRGLLEAVEALRDLEGLHFRIAGTGPLAPAFRNGPAAEGGVSFLGQLSHKQVLEETARSSALLAWYDPSVPANRLASPNKLFEGMMLARPVIVSAGTRMAEIVEEVGCGLVVPYGEAPALREAVARLRSDPALGSRLGRNGREAFRRRYNWQANERRLLAAYARVLPGGTDQE